MANQKVLEEYLVGSENSYLRSDDNNGKVIMLSGKWGSGKTHFWQDKIATDKLKEELKRDEKCYSYVSLYGKSSIEEIENDIFGQVYIDAIGGDNFVRKGFSTFTKIMGRYGLSKIGNGLDKEQKENIERIALKRLNNGGIICFDDFERKSKEIDLNDLFGFITQLSLNFECKIVIILNDDVFEGKEKDIFSNVKEKTVSKYLYYKPSIEELFDLIFDDEKYKRLESHKELILKTIEETEELNARIYIQVLDNLLEWIENTNEEEHSDEILRCIILVNINFILFHTSAFLGEPKTKFEKNSYEDIHFRINLKESYSNRIKSLCSYILSKEYKFPKNDDLLRVASSYLRSNIPRNEIGNRTEHDIEYLKENEILVKSLFFLIKLEVIKNVEDTVFEKINNFIETGILIKDENK
ncbi:P-loop NTPase fold protein [Halarcobacter bivalviorum]|uniref:P-loop NTPase fold protein n=1 Tax=Halarcobacter bivalviorum TaxID=663364 RepID=UPI0019D6CB8A|nr:P-loop NTPase fold protein [Halarcobacter bivalviorum]